MAFDASKYDEHDLKMAFRIFDELLGDFEMARTAVLKQKDDLTPNESYQIAVELKVCGTILDNIKDEMDIRELDRVEQNEE